MASMLRLGTPFENSSSSAIDDIHPDLSETDSEQLVRVIDMRGYE